MGLGSYSSLCWISETMHSESSVRAMWFLPCAVIEFWVIVRSSKIVLFSVALGCWPDCLIEFELVMCTEERCSELTLPVFPGDFTDVSIRDFTEVSFRESSRKPVIKSLLKKSNASSFD